MDYKGTPLAASDTCFTGFRKTRVPLLKEWLLWRVQEQAGALWLVSVIEPAHQVALTPELAREVVRMDLSPQFSYERFPDFYELAHAFGIELWASQQPFYGVIQLNARSYQTTVNGECWASETRSYYTEYSVTEALTILENLVFEVVKQVVNV